MGGKMAAEADQYSRENHMKDELGRPFAAAGCSPQHTSQKLDAGADTVDARAKDQDVRCSKAEVIGSAPVTSGTSNLSGPATQRQLCQSGFTAGQIPSS